jgi:Deoxyribonuclease NucA/NucB
MHVKLGKFPRWGAAAATALAVLSLAGAGQASAPSTDQSPATEEGVTAQAVPAITLRVGVEGATLDQLLAQAKKGALSVLTQPTQPTERDAVYNTTPGNRLSLVEAERMSRAQAARNWQPASLATASGASGPAIQAAPITDQPDAGLVNECFNAGGADQGIGRVHNRFTYCLELRLSAEYWEIDNKGIPLEKRGTTHGTMEVFAQGDENIRRIRVFTRIKADSVDYDWGPIDDIFVAPNVPLSFIAQCVQDSEICHATRGPVTMPWVTWDNNTEWFSWDVYNHETLTEGRDKISYNEWFVEAFTDDKEFKTLVSAETDSRMIRCDSAHYFRRGVAPFPRACIFSEVIPHLNYELGSTHHAVAFHIYTAQFFPNTTHPFLVPPGVPPPRDKRIPGRFEPDNPSAPGLHRITDQLHPGPVLANSQHKDGACYKTGPYAAEYFDTGLPVPPSPPAEQCDEYPFASTLEGAAHPYWDFSVMAVPQRENSVAGGLLNKFYIDDRILAWDVDLPDPDETNDRFYVHIR